jgi:glutamate dehydrogenase (NAD(P)+)
MLQEFNLAARLLNLDPASGGSSRTPNGRSSAPVPIQMDNGEIEVFTGYPRAIQHHARPGQGGIRYHPA